MKERIKGLNRRIFKRNLKKVLKPEYRSQLQFTFEEWVKEYHEKSEINGVYGWFEVKSFEHKNNHAEEIRTN